MGKDKNTKQAKPKLWSRLKQWLCVFDTIKRKYFKNKYEIRFIINDTLTGGTGYIDPKVEDILYLYKEGIIIKSRKLKFTIKPRNKKCV